jgi:hypothetical protein
LLIKCDFVENKLLNLLRNPKSMNGVTISLDEDTMLAFSEFTEERKNEFYRAAQLLLQQHIKAERTAKIKELIFELQRETKEELNADMLMVLMHCD